LYILVEKMLVFFLKECKMGGRAGNNLSGLRWEVGAGIRNYKEKGIENETD
jgi:hypothetical protein